LILSGGLNADNVGDAITVARPYAVDTASGTEAAPGHKDPDKLRAFFLAAGEGAYADRQAPRGDRSTAAIPSPGARSAARSGHPA
jgi:phosphoribosylanthranilate isomerase